EIYRDIVIRTMHRAKQAVERTVSQTPVSADMLAAMRDRHRRCRNRQKDIFDAVLTRSEKWSDVDIERKLAPPNGEGFLCEWLYRPAIGVALTKCEVFRLLRDEPLALGQLTREARLTALDQQFRFELVCRSEARKCRQDGQDQHQRHS